MRIWRKGTENIMSFHITLVNSQKYKYNLNISATPNNNVIEQDKSFKITQRL